MIELAETRLRRPSQRCKQRLVAMAAHLRCHGDNATRARRETLALSRWPNPLRCEDAAVQQGWEDALQVRARVRVLGPGSGLGVRAGGWGLGLRLG